VILAWISIAALVVAVLLSCFTTINVGLLSMAMALVIGVYLGGMSLDRVLAEFPVSLFVTLIGVTLLFSIAESNGTLARVTARAVRLCRGHAGILPVMFFLLGFVIATIGAGATPASALLAGPAMAVAGRAGISPLLMAIMAGNGVLAGTLSPFAPTGIVAHGVMERIGLGGVEWQTFAFNALAHTLVALGGFVVFGGLQLFKRKNGAGGGSGGAAAEATAADPMQTRHWLTAGGIALLIITVAGFGMDVGLVALVIAVSLTLLRTVDEPKAIKGMPWGVILMVTGVSVLISMMRETQGLALITSGIANLSSPATIAPIVSFGVGLVSVYSSTSGVVLPAFLPMAPDLAQHLGLPPLPIAWSMNVAASLVDLSSLSTVGALFITGAAPGSDVRSLFNQLLLWGLSMTLVGAALCWLLFGL
jgi:di/tricarboxylate transporter